MILRSDLIVAESGGTIFAPGAVRFRPASAGEPGEILQVGSADEVLASAEGGEEVRDLGGRWLLPGLVQAHVHLNQTLFRGLAEGRELLPWLRERIWPLEAAHDAASVEASAALSAAEMLLAGATSALTIETTRHTEAAFRGADRLGLRAAIGSALMDLPGEDVPSGLVRSGSEALEEMVQLNRRWKQRTGGRLRGCVAPRFVLSCSEELLVRSSRLAAEEGMVWHTHVSENEAETEEVRERTGMENGEYFDHLGLLGPHASLAHGVWLTVREMERLGELGVNLLHCPAANLKLGSGIADTPAMERAGITLALGSDGAPCNNRLDAFAELRLAGLLASRRGGPEGLDPSRPFHWATRGGARALGLEGATGALQPGRRPDMIALAPASWAGDPADPSQVYGHLVFAASSEDVTHTWVDGREVVREGELLTADLEELRARFREQRAAVVRRAGI